MGSDSSYNGERIHPFALRSRARAELCFVLAEVFGYPSTDSSEILASQDMIDCCRVLVDEARLDLDESRVMEDSASQKHGCPADGAGEGTSLSEGHRLRAECTRLFWSYPRLVRLEGRYWAKSDRRGEVVAVGALYRELGLCNKDGLNAPPDVLASELDYLAYVLRAEADAWDSEDSLSALEWRQLGVDFLDKHLRACATGVAGATLEHSENEFLRFYAALLTCCVAG